MKHSDKNQEFDNLFKNAFDDAEMQPSERVWLGVEKELDKNKKGIVVTWVARLSIAASVVLVMSVGLYQLNFFGNEVATQENATLANTNKNEGVASTDSNPSKKVEKNIEAVQPISKDNRLVDVVEIKSRTTRSSKGIKKQPNLNSKLKGVNRSQEEKEAIELLKKLEEKVETNRNTPVVEPENKRPVIKPVPVPAPSENVANNTGSKKEVGVVEMLNYVAKKVSGNEESNLVAVNETKKEDGSLRKRYEVDLGIVKFSRTKNTNR
jgi:hypothetical protein